MFDIQMMCKCTYGEKREVTDRVTRILFSTEVMF